MQNRIFAVFCIGFLLGGCAVSRGQIDIPVAQVTNPESSIVVKITEVNDRRVFEVSPRRPNIPSLDESAPNDRSVEKRAVARKRGGFGAALGDIVLPEGRTVEQVINEALTTALRQSDIRVVSKGEPEYDTARPLQADISKFWAWFRPGFFQIAIEHESEIILKGSWPVALADQTIQSKARLTGQIISSSDWRELFNMGIDTLIENVKRVIKRSSEQRRSVPAKINQIISKPTLS